MNPKKVSGGVGFGIERRFTKEIIVGRCLERERALAYRAAAELSMPPGTASGARYETPEYHTINGSRFVNGLSRFSLVNFGALKRNVHTCRTCGQFFNPSVQIKSFDADLVRAFGNVVFNSHPVEIRTARGLNEFCRIPAKGVDVAGRRHAESSVVPRNKKGASLMSKKFMSIMRMAISSWFILGLPLNIWAEPTEKPDEVIIEGQERLKLEKEDVSKEEFPLPSDKFLSAPKIERDGKATVHFLDSERKKIKERPMAYKAFKIPAQEVKLKPGRGAKTRRIEARMEEIKYEEPYHMAAAQGVFIAHWKEPESPQDAHEDASIEYTEVWSKDGTRVTTIQGDYWLEAAPGMAYFVGVLCYGGLVNQSGTVAFFDKNGKLINQRKIFDFGGSAHIGISPDGAYVLYTFA